MSGKKTMLFPFRPLDYQAAEAWLHAQAQAGWELTGLGLWQTARFQRAAQPRQVAVVLRYEPNTNGAQQESFEAYKAFLTSCGWQHIASQQFLHVFAGPPGEVLPPLETDPAAEAMQVRKQYVRRVQISWLILGLYALFLWLVLRGAELQWVPLLSSNRNLAAIPMFAVLLGSLLIQAGQLLRWGPRLRAAEKEGAPLPRRPVAQAYRQGLVEMVCTIATLLLIGIALVADTVQDIMNIRFLLQVGWLVCLILFTRIQPKDTVKRVLAGVLGGAILVGWLASTGMQKPPPTAAQLENAPVFTGAVDEVHFRSLEQSKSPLFSCTEYWESGIGSLKSYCVDAANDTLAYAAFGEVAYGSRSEITAGLQRLSLPGMDTALYYEGEGFQMLALQRGRRVVRVERFLSAWDRQEYKLPEPSALYSPEMLARVREAFFSAG